MPQSQASLYRDGAFGNILEGPLGSETSVGLLIGFCIRGERRIASRRPPRTRTPIQKTRCKGPDFTARLFRAYSQLRVLEEPGGQTLQLQLAFPEEATEKINTI